MKLSQIINGFLLGLGFTTSFLAIGILYSLTLEHRIEAIVQDAKNDLASIKLDQNFVDAMKLEIVDYEIKDDLINIAVKSINLDDPVFSSLFTVRASLFSKDSKFMGNCDSKVPEVNTNAELIYYSLACETTFIPISEFKHATVSIIRNRDRL